MIPKDIWIRNVVESLKQLASEEFQVKGWVENEIHDYCTFIETSCGFLMDDDIEGFLKHAKEFGFSEEQIKKIDKVRIEFERYSDEKSGYEDPLTIINDPEWHKIRSLAKEALDSLGITRYLDPSKSIIKYSLLYNIFWISDSQGQHRIWILERRANSNPFKELLDGFFNTSKASKVIANYKEYEITDEQVKKLKELYELLKNYGEKVKDEENLQKILDDPEWRQIQTFAKETILIFDFKP